MRIGIDVRLQNETGVGRYIRNLVTLLPKVAPQHQYVFINPAIRWHSVDEQLKMPGIIDSYKLDLVHIPYFNVPLFLQTPFVMTMHDLIVDQYGTGRVSTLPFPMYVLKRLGYKFVTASAMDRAKSIVVPSNTIKQEVVAMYHVPEEKVAVTYEGVDAVLGKNYKKPSLGIDHEKYFLYVGNAYPHKNVDRLIDAFKMVDTDAKLVLVGQDNYFYSKLKENVGVHSARVVFAGLVTDDELFWLYKNAIALVFPSLAEGFGLPVLEAMSMGTPILASNIAVFRELFKDIPEYFDPYNASDIKKSLEKALKESFAKQKENGRKLARTFSWEKMAQETAHIYESSISLRSSK
jgi:glycosyltransferase involved in cell wall biosynthesis